jgi:hypothetical protein
MAPAAVRRASRRGYRGVAFGLPGGRWPWSCFSAMVISFDPLPQFGFVRREGRVSLLAELVRCAERDVT